MRLFRHLLLPAATVALFWLGCDSTGVEPSDEVPVLYIPQTLFDERDERFYAAVTVTLPEAGAAPDSIWTELYLASGDLADSLGTDSAWAQVTLNDTAANGDILPRDDVYACKFDSPLPPGTGGSVRFEFHAIAAGDTSSVTDSLSLTNLRPVIVAVLLTKESIVRPDSGAVVIDTLYVTAADPDSLEDVRSITFQIVKPDSSLRIGLNGSTSFPLYDDGTREDVTQDDGTFSGGVTFGYQDPIGTYTLRFTAKDFSGAVSDTVSQAVVVQ